MENRFRPQTEAPAKEAPAREERQPKATRKPSGFNPFTLLRQLLDGTLLTNQNITRNIPFILFITLLAILYISNSSGAEKNRRELMQLTEDLKELRYKYISTKSGVMYHSNPSQISERLKETGIRENTVPPVKIFIPASTEKK